MGKYLDNLGLTYLWSKIKDTFAAKADAIKNITRSGKTFTATRADGTTFTFTQQDTTYSTATSSANGLMSSGDKSKADNMAMITYGTCSTAAGTAAKVVTLTNENWQLKVGSIVGVKFSVTNTYSATAAAPITLNVNNTGAKSIWYNTGVPTGTSASVFGYANRHIFYIYDGTYWVWLGMGALDGNNNTVPQAQCETAAGTAAKVGTITNYSLLKDSYVMVNLRYANSAASAITLNLNSRGAKPIYINGAASGTTNYNLPAGSYLVFYDGTNFYFRTDGKITGSITGDASTVNGHTVNIDVPSTAEFTDTTYEEATTSNAGLMAAADKTKLNGIATGAEVNVQADWNVTDSTSDAFIKNKPTIPSVDSALSASSTNPVQNKAINTALAAKAPLASPTLTGTPKAPTASSGTNTTQIATTAFVQSELSIIGGFGDYFYESSFADVNVPTATWTEVCTITVPIGIWFYSIAIQIPAVTVTGNTRYVEARMYKQDGSSVGVVTCDSKVLVSGTVNFIHINFPIMRETPATFTVKLRQVTGDTLTVMPRYGRIGFAG